jgi:flagellar motor switch protein FliM
MNADLLLEIKKTLKKSIVHLRYRYEKVLKIDLNGTGEFSEQELEILESFSSRFARTSDIAVSKYLS